MAILKGIGKPGSGAYLPGKLYREWIAKVRRHDQLEAALERIAKCETEVTGLAPEFYGHAQAIAEKALRVKSNDQGVPAAAGGTESTNKPCPPLGTTA